MTQEYMERLAKAIRATEYKYFGDYELSPDQWEAVDTLVAHAKQCAGIEPVGYLHFYGKAYRFSALPFAAIDETPDRIEPLYFIPAPEPKP